MSRDPGQPPRSAGAPAPFVTRKGPPARHGRAYRAFLTHRKDGA